jgi:hypothetical protein
MNIHPGSPLEAVPPGETISTTAQGNAFRDRVRDLLALHPACSNLQTERRIGSQTVDIYYEEQTSVRTRRIACECKDYEGPLTKSIIEREVYVKYRPLLDANLIDDVRIIAPLEIGTEAQQYVEMKPLLVHDLGSAGGRDHRFPRVHAVTVCAVRRGRPRSVLHRASARGRSRP